ncbi:flagellar basal body P-ring formation chaperone FlgA [Legionella dresdenensis]|uniref:Flagella basal body P-ring formation protein FlgA n=1 Tax=Legionella dresdenensis TaxID=450200 RepID=A0ABV8CBX3_9GAMM
MFSRLICGILLVLTATLSYAEEEEQQSLSVLSALVEQHLMQELASQNANKIRINTDKIDPRLQLKACADDKLEVFNPHQTTAQTTTMGVRCTEKENHWTVYIPVKITIMKQVIVANRALTKGAIVSPLTIDLQEVDVSQLKQGYFTEVDEVLGMSCKSQIQSGTILTPAQLQKPLLIHKGEQVTIQALNEGFKVSMSGVALEDGSIGEHINVKNISSKKSIEAKVIAPGQVQVIL